MAKLECELTGDFDTIVETIDHEVVNSSISATKEDQSDFSSEDSRCTVLVYERYSMFGDNRVSLNVTLYEANGRIFMSAITSGGSQAVLFKLNLLDTLGEETFLDVLAGIIEPFQI